MNKKVLKFKTVTHFDIYQNLQDHKISAIQMQSQKKI